MQDIWRSIDVIVSRDPMLSDRYHVEFRPRENLEQRPKGPATSIPRNMVLIVEDRGELHVNSFSHASTPIPDRNQGDYERKAILAVTDFRLHNQMTPDPD